MDNWVKLVLLSENGCIQEVSNIQLLMFDIISIDTNEGIDAEGSRWNWEERITNICRNKINLAISNIYSICEIGRNPRIEICKCLKTKSGQKTKTEAQILKMKKSPIGIQTFSKMLEGDYAYVDKTEIAYHLISTGTYYFLARPRRFGKSLFLDTLKEIFEGNRRLSKGFIIEDKWNFENKYPVLHISFGAGVNKAGVKKLNNSVIIEGAVKSPESYALSATRRISDPIL